MKNYDKEKWLQEKAEQKEQLKSKLKDISDNFKVDPTLIAEYISFSSKFYKYSANNSQLLYMQNSHAQFVGSYNYFKENGYAVQKGEKSMQIFVPAIVTLFEDDNGDIKQISQATKEEKRKVRNGEIKSFKTTTFKLGNVFDVSQTDCPIEDYPKLFDVGYTSEQHSTAYNELSLYAQEKLNCTIEFEKSPINHRGSYYPELNKITINQSLEDSEMLSTLCHELGHAVLHQQEDKTKSANQMEAEADMFGIMLQSHCGIELTNSRKKHYSDNYRNLEKEFTNDETTGDNATLTFNSVLNNVFANFKDYMKHAEENSKEKNINTIKNYTLEQAQEVEM